MSLIKMFGWLVVLVGIAMLLTQIVFAVFDPNPNIKGDVGASVGIFLGTVAAYFLFISKYSPLSKVKFNASFD
jgi:hypothetical protein